MSIIDTVDDVLREHERQEPRVAIIANVVRTLRADEDAIDAQRYQPDRARELKAAKRSAASEDIAADLVRLAVDCDAKTAREQEAAAEAERQRAATMHGPAVDPARFTAASSAAEVVLLLREAEAAGGDALRKTWAFAEPRLKAMALSDQQQHRLPHAGSAFTAWSLWQLRVRDVSHRSPDREAIAERADRDKSALRSRVMQVAATVGLDAAVEQAARRAALAPPPKSNVTFGRNFETFFQRR